MSGYLTDIEKQALLTTMTSGSTYLGLAVSVPSGSQPNLATIQEVADAGYTRQPMSWGTPTFPAPVYVASNSAVSFGPFTAGMASAAAYVFLTNVSTGNALAAPTSLVAASPTSGGTYAAGTYFFVVTAMNSQGETVGSNEVSATLTANQQVSLSWAAVSGSGITYNVYQGSSAGNENVKVGSSVTGTTFVATGAAGNAGFPSGVTTAPVGNILYVWPLANTVQATAGRPVQIGLGGIVIQ